MKQEAEDRWTRMDVRLVGGCGPVELYVSMLLESLCGVCVSNVIIY